MPDQKFEKLYEYVLGNLFPQLSEDLSYHNERHSLDVLNVCEQKIRDEELDGNQAEMLRVAALLHDIGFVRSMDDHETHSCIIAEELLPEFGYERGFIDEVKSMIMSTKVPQKPESFLAMLLCDADLDYLGRADFKMISNDLFEEMKFRGVVRTQAEWDAIQIRFLSTHTYWTEHSVRTRAAAKNEQLQKLIQLYS